MPENSQGLHESPDALQPETLDRHRAIASLMEELEAVDWYQQRVDATDDEELKAILAHNRDEEKEHASMVLEWLRRHDPRLDEHLRTYLFTTAPITEVEAQADSGAPAPQEGGDGEGGGGSLGIGGLRGDTL